MAQTYNFPEDLRTAQDELDQVRGDLQRLLKRQPWSVEPLPAWDSHENSWRPASRPDSPGWNSEDQATHGQLRVRETELAALIVCHSFWETVEPAERSTARSQLKHHRDHALAA
ncbi:hypothetical protein ACGFWD_40295 [Streptomyces sp. NPDC048448]|uniref:hypothetical protein n=1 Tax=unclassified Streptomyces TaxID=2593676 RepID=UPI002E358852|nr:hypothetical protein [Streptomyces sp. NBC_01462]